MGGVAAGRHFCLRHRSSRNKFVPTCPVAWHIPSRPLQGDNQPAIFASPAIADLHVPPGERADVESKSLPTRRWAEKIEQMEANRLNSFRNYSSGEEDDESVDEDEDDESEGELDGGEGLEGGNEMGARERPHFTFSPYRAGQPQVVDFLPVEGKLNMQADNGPLLQQAREAILQLQEVAANLGVAIPAEGTRAVRHLEEVLRDLPDLVSSATTEAEEAARALGNVTLLPGHASVVDALRDLQDRAAMQADLDAKTKDLGLALDGVEDEMAKELEATGQTLLTAVGGLARRLQVLEGGGALGAPFMGPGGTTNFPSSIPHDVAFQDAAGATTCTMGELAAELTLARAERKALQDRLDKVEAAAVSQGGVTFGQHQFSSERDILAIVLAEDPQGKAIAAFVHANTIFVHDGEYEPKKGWRDGVKAAIKSGAFEDAETKFLSAATLRYPYHYTAGGEVVAGKLLAAFTSSDHWAGHGVIAGAKGRLVASLTTSQLALATYISDKLPPGSVLQRLATEMYLATFSWFGKVHAFFDEDLKALVELGVPVEETLTLLSEYVILMFDVFYRQTQQMRKYSEGMNRAEYEARAIWVALRIHADMESFAGAGRMKHNSTIAAAFIRFLTKATAANSSTSLGSKVASVEKAVKGANLSQLKSDVKTSLSNAHKAVEELAKVKDDLAKLKRK